MFPFLAYERNTLLIIFHYYHTKINNTYLKFASRNEPKGDLILSLVYKIFINESILGYFWHFLVSYFETRSSVIFFNINVYHFNQLIIKVRID